MKQLSFHDKQSLLYCFHRAMYASTPDIQAVFRMYPDINTHFNLQVLLNRKLLSKVTNGQYALTAKGLSIALKELKRDVKLERLVPIDLPEWVVGN